MPRLDTLSGSILLLSLLLVPPLHAGPLGQDGAQEVSRIRPQGTPGLLFADGWKPETTRREGFRLEVRARFGMGFDDPLYQLEVHAEDPTLEARVLSVRYSAECARSQCFPQEVVGARERDTHYRRVVRPEDGGISLDSLSAQVEISVPQWIGDPARRTVELMIHNVRNGYRGLRREVPRWIAFPVTTERLSEAGGSGVHIRHRIDLDADANVRGMIQAVQHEVVTQGPNGHYLDLGRNFESGVGTDLSVTTEELWECGGPDYRDCWARQIYSTWILWKDGAMSMLDFRPLYEVPGVTPLP